MPQVNSLLNDNDEDIEDTHRGSGHKQDREITLGTTMVLGIFFALAVFGAVMFGFGYSLGGKHAAATSVTAETNPNTTFNGFKPPSGKVSDDYARPPAPPAAVTVPLGAVPPVQTKPAAVKPNPDPLSITDPELTPTRPVSVAPAPRPASALAPAVPVPAVSSAGQMMVQIAAVSHQEDADLLVTTLKRRSYAVAIHHEPQDQLLHVQVGPFATRKDADAMRLRLQADGFNAIVKGPAN